MMKEDRQEKLKISNDLLDAMLEGVRTQEDLWGKEGIITRLNKALLERILNAEMDFHLNNTNDGRANGNTRNGYGKKTLKSNFGHLELSTPRDRHSTFEPQIIPKRSTKTAMLEEAILSLYAKGMTVRDIQATLQDLYHVEVSPSLISKVTDVVNEEVEQWRDRKCIKIIRFSIKRYILHWQSTWRVIRNCLVSGYRSTKERHSGHKYSRSFPTEG